MGSFPPAAPAQVSSRFQLFARAPGRTQRKAKPLSLILIFKAIYRELQLRPRGRGRQHKVSVRAPGPGSNCWGSSKLLCRRNCTLSPVSMRCREVGGDLGFSSFDRVLYLVFTQTGCQRWVILCCRRGYFFFIYFILQRDLCVSEYL